MKIYLLEVSIFSTPIGIGIIVISFIVSVYVTRWIFGIDRIINNQEKTNALLKELSSKFDTPEKRNDTGNLIQGDANNPMALNDYIKKLNEQKE